MNIHVVILTIRIIVILTIRITFMSYTVNAHSIRAMHSQLFEMLNNLAGKGVNVHALILCETFMNQLDMSVKVIFHDMINILKYFNFRQNKRGEVG